MINQQPPEPFDKSTGQELDVHSVFHTLQGEGPFTGAPSIFVRLAGCNLQCGMCDTEYTQGRERLKITELYSRVWQIAMQFPNTQLIVLTGGEPTRQNIGPFITMLTEEFHVQIESNGVYSPGKDVLDLVEASKVSYVVSPKTRRVHPDTKHATCFKYVISSTSYDWIDGLPILALNHKAAPHVARPPKDFKGYVFVNPMDAKDEAANRENLIACRDSALRFGYRLGVQLHKLIDLP